MTDGKRRASIDTSQSLCREDVYVGWAKRIRFMPKTYTFHARNVYVFIAKRIRFTRDMYTLHTARVYVLFSIPTFFPFGGNHAQPSTSLLHNK